MWLKAGIAGVGEGLGVGVGLGEGLGVGEDALALELGSGEALAACEFEGNAPEGGVGVGFEPHEARTRAAANSPIDVRNLADEVMS